MAVVPFNALFADGPAGNPYQPPKQDLRDTFNDLNGRISTVSESVHYSTEFGFVDDGVAGVDTGTDNDAAWAAAKAALTNGETLVMVRQNTGVFYFATTSDFTGIPIDATSNPTFNGPNVYNDRTSAEVAAGGPPITIVGAGRLTSISTSLNVTYRRHAEPVAKADFLTDGDVAYDEPTVVDMSGAAVTMLKYAWPNGNTTSATSTGITKTTNDIQINRATADNSVLMFAGVVPEATCQYSWVVGPNVNDVPFAVIAFDGGYHAVYAALNSRAIHKKLTAPSIFTEVNIPDFGARITPETSYTFAQGSITIDLITPTKYQVGLNGVVFAEGDLPSPALYVGPGLFFGPGQTGTSHFFNMVKVKNPSRLAPRPIRALFVGDSKMDPVFQGWPDDIARIMQGSMGVQWEYTRNIAVAGETLAQQLTRILALDMTGYTDVFIGLGTNDAQGLTSQTTFATNLGLMLNQALSLGARVTLLLTPAFYTRADGYAVTGFVNQGQASVNGAAVPAYREIIRRVVATYRDAGSKVALVDAGKICGPTLAQYLTWASSWSGSRVDTNVFDNIHEGRTARTKIAQACARAAFGLATPARTKKYPSLLTSAVPASWYANSWTASSPAAVFWIDERGYKHLDGVIQANAGPLADATVVMTLPTYMRPARNIQLAAVGSKVATAGQANQTWVEILATGDVRVYGVDTTNKFVRLSDAHWE
ncbi:SGNH/GDSL hydrolase family protein [Mesorhizobium japonicum]|uniref:Mlr8545 protein n=1 Tax=Mesorhizobium japonicum (strain LMG 29417 / CECT 9101 / MAFF 303099) TaxID=266835 RepID=Q982Q1_RHILO|nr:SGNH/GDSL hydrolase family protein [Mesorhizobium japonicum]BAB54405.1 mlr8545 [Mesorhizobium japonicum MAFF 303099]